MRVTAITLCLALSSCAFAVKHPAITSGLVGGSIGLLTCEMGTGFDLTDGKMVATCGAIGGGVGLALGGIVALAVLLGGEGNTVLQEGMTEDPPPLVRKKKQPEPEPQPAPEPAPEPPPPTTPAP
jgi:hypothetical protein